MLCISHGITNFEKFKRDCIKVGVKTTRVRGLSYSALA